MMSWVIGQTKDSGMEIMVVGGLRSVASFFRWRVFISIEVGTCTEHTRRK